MEKLLILCEASDSALPIHEALADRFECEVETDTDIGFAKFRQFRYEYCFVETTRLLQFCGETPTTYKKSLEQLRKFHPTVPIIVFSDQGQVQDTIEAVRSGASNYLISPFNKEEVVLLTGRAHHQEVLQAEIDYLKDQFWDDSVSDIVITNSGVMKDVFEKVKSVANTSSTILLTGETGVGKSLVAKLLHEHSARKNESFVSVHCGAIPENLVESELFGHEKGSFTGAIRRKLGRFEIANRGTIFLDEIGTISPATQIKLLQVLQESTFQRVGGESDIKVDVRIIAATNEDLKEMSELKTFRSDLFYRLNVFPIHIPPLRERLEDIPLLCQRFLTGLNLRYSKNIKGLSDATILALQSYRWPGNIRELENVLERAYIIEPTPTINPESLPKELVENSDSTAFVPMDTSLTLSEVRNRAIEDIERQYLKEVLTMNRGRINESAKVAGVGTRQLHKLMTKYGLSKVEFKHTEN